MVFFRSQDLVIDDQKLLAQRLGQLTGKPETSGLYRHPILNKKWGVPVDGKDRYDDEVQPISSVKNRETWNHIWGNNTKAIASSGWHSDNTYERVPSDYAVLKMTVVPKDPGGDTLWGSGYEAYDRLSPPFQKFVEGLTATHHNLEYDGKAILDGTRGSPENLSNDATAEQCVSSPSIVSNDQDALFLQGNKGLIG